MRRRRPSSPSRRKAAAVTAAGSSGSTSNPVSPSRTASGIPPERLAMTGSPLADASTMAIPNPSTSRSYRRDASTNRSAALYSEGRSSSGTKPSSRTASTSPSSLTSASSAPRRLPLPATDRKSTRLNSSHLVISYAVFCLKKKKKKKKVQYVRQDLQVHENII